MKLTIYAEDFYPEAPDGRDFPKVVPSHVKHAMDVCRTVIYAGRDVTVLVKNYPSNIGVGREVAS